MKKLFLLMMAFVAGSAILFTSCNPDEPTDVEPTISFKTGADYVSTNVTVEAGSVITIGIDADANENSGALLTNLNLKRAFGVQTTLWDTAINVNTFSIVFDLTTFPEAGEETVTFTITDAEGETAEVSLIITTEITYQPLNVWEDVTLGDQDSQFGSSFASIDGTTYSLAEAKENSDKIDFVYFYGATNHSTICAPSADAAAEVFNNPTTGVATWTKRNATKFMATTTTVDEFDAIPADNDTQVITLATGADQELINNLDQDGAPVVLAFETETLKKGLIKIQEIVVGSGVGTPGHILITVKVQQ
ncbi:MAG: hypothetical protein EOL88_00405 [Bacteroidia bacterium]|nr:hypothetical protein [Bacteroidales bacterium]NCD40530.1 hypothetical protein [Bacteroidia bacterium]MDD2322003.1 hypothetical protein [Bacteroidales bacterium]MDD3010040.1 hypothetical protein [Bacteroidales bacterium]MDD3960831.1 hypothetical protein [Bacteroidales bacterium]